MSGPLVGICLALLIDESGSIPPEVGRQVFDAHAAALLQPRVVRAVESEGLVLGVWAFGGRTRTIIEPTVVRAEGELRSLAGRIEAAYRPPEGWTATGGALGDVWRAMQNQPCDRVIIDVVTDGLPHDRPILAEVRAELEAEGATLNALIFETEKGVMPEQGLGEWARAELATSGGFVMEAATWQEWVGSIGRKLVFEIGYLGSD